MGVLLSAQVENITTRKDRTLKIVIGTQEIDSKKMAELMSLNQNLAHVYINSTNITPEQVEVVDSAEKEVIEGTGKSQSQRIRAILYKLWVQNNEGFKNANDFYVSKTEAIITHLKKQIL